MSFEETSKKYRGSRGYDDDIILMFATNASLSNDFSIEITASGLESTSHAYQAGHCTRPSGRMTSENSTREGCDIVQVDYEIGNFNRVRRLQCLCMVPELEPGSGDLLDQRGCRYGQQRLHGEHLVIPGSNFLRAVRTRYLIMAKKC